METVSVPRTLNDAMGIDVVVTFPEPVEDEEEQLEPGEGCDEDEEKKHEGL